MSDAKAIRKQVRNVVQEILPEILKEELIKAVREHVAKEMTAKLSKIEANVRDTLELVDNRSKDSLGYLVRQATAPVMDRPASPPETPPVLDEE